MVMMMAMVNKFCHWNCTFVWGKLELCPCHHHYRQHPNEEVESIKIGFLIQPGLVREDQSPMTLLWDRGVLGQLAAPRNGDIIIMIIGMLRIFAETLKNIRKGLSRDG